MCRGSSVPTQMGTGCGTRKPTCGSGSSGTRPQRLRPLRPRRARSELPFAPGCLCCHRASGKTSPFDSLSPSHSAPGPWAWSAGGLAAAAHRPPRTLATARHRARATVRAGALAGALAGTRAGTRAGALAGALAGTLAGRGRESAFFSKPLLPSGLWQQPLPNAPRVFARFGIVSKPLLPFRAFGRNVRAAPLRAQTLG